jgi:hypothetical protein
MQCTVWAYCVLNLVIEIATAMCAAAADAAATSAATVLEAVGAAVVVSVWRWALLLTTLDAGSVHTLASLLRHGMDLISYGQRGSNSSDQASQQQVRVGHIVCAV